MAVSRVKSTPNIAVRLVSTVIIEIVAAAICGDVLVHFRPAPLRRRRKPPKNGPIAAQTGPKPGVKVAQGVEHLQGVSKEQKGPFRESNPGPLAYSLYQLESWGSWRESI